MIKPSVNIGEETWFFAYFYIGFYSFFCVRDTGMVICNYCKQDVEVVNAIQYCPQCQMTIKLVEVRKQNRKNVIQFFLLCILIILGLFGLSWLFAP